jgi:uncharacterized membrane protein
METLILRLNKRVRAGVAILITCAASCLALRVGALPAYLEAARSAYAFKPGGTIDAKGCNLCHAGATNRNSLNLYGKDVQTALQTAPGRTMTPAVLHTLDEKDSDGDGWPNAQEFAADTLPGDPTSKPAGPPPGTLKPSTPQAGGAAFNPFSVQEVFFPTHAQHPIIVHFPIALFVFSLFLDVLGIRTRNRALNAAAYYNLVAAAVTGVLAVITGLLAWRFAFGGEPLTSDRWLFFHLVLGVITTLLMLALWAIRAKQPINADQPLSRAYIILGALTLCVISVTGHFGGIVSGIVR